METKLPSQVAEALAANAAAIHAKQNRYRVRAGTREVRLVDLALDGFVIEADGRPPLRGYADIFRGDECILRGLVICAWAADGLVGYEFKRGTTDGTPPSDYVRGPVAGLLPSV